MTEKIGRAKSMVFADYTGIKHKQLETLRKKLKAVDAELMVTKNTLLERAFGNQAKTVANFLKEKTATVFSYADEVAGIKELVAFFKTVSLGKSKGGLLGLTVLTADDVTKLAQLPTRNILLGQLAGQLMAPLSGLHYSLSWNINKLVWGLNSIKNKKSL